MPSNPRMTSFCEYVDGGRLEPLQARRPAVAMETAIANARADVNIWMAEL
jgi:hypothetical protein